MTSKKLKTKYYSVWDYCFNSVSTLKRHRIYTGYYLVINKVRVHKVIKIKDTIFTANTL